MARRKNNYLSDGSDSELSASSGGAYDSLEDPDAQDERRLFEQKGSKRRRTNGRNGKNAAWEGIFGDDEDQGGRRGIGGSKWRGVTSRADITKLVIISSIAPEFVSTGKHDLQEEEEQGLGEQRARDEQVQEENSKSNYSDSSGSESDEYQSQSRSPRVHDGGDENKTLAGNDSGFESARNKGQAPEVSPSNGRGGIGSLRGSKAGLGAFPSARASSSTTSTSINEGSPTGALESSKNDANPNDDFRFHSSNVLRAFGRLPPSLVTPSEDRPRPQQSFLPKESRPPVAKKAELTTHEKAHFANIKSSFGARLLANMGWEAGKGLGVQEDGRAVPIAVGTHLKGKGIQKGIRTEDSKREARRQGITMSDDEENKTHKRRAHKAKGLNLYKAKVEDNEGWKKQKKIKVKVEHKTYEQLLAEAGEVAPTASIGLVLDARGGDLKEVQSFSSLSLSTWAPTSDAIKLPELRHNLRLIVDASNQDVIGMIKEGKKVHERRQWALREERFARDRVEEANNRISRLRQVQVLINDIRATAEQQLSSRDASLEPFAGSFNSLINDYKDEYKSLSLDDVVVGAISQVMRDALTDWQPFDITSDVLCSSLETWRIAYNLPHGNQDELILFSAGNERDDSTMDKKNGDRVMTAWESFLWTSWLPKVRSAINNDWDPTDGNAAAQILLKWGSILPAFIRDNVLDQLVLPKIKAAIDQWDPRRSQVSLSVIVFPWLPLLGTRVDEIMELAKRRIRSVLRKWTVKDGVPEDLVRWKKTVYSSNEWDKLILQFVLPKLGICLRDDFAINPRKQDMVPLKSWVLPWHELIRPSMFSHLLEAEFFPKWLSMLHVWLVQPNYVHREVTDWYSWWKNQLPELVLQMPGVIHGFNIGVDLMQKALELGADASSKLAKPSFKPLSSVQSIEPSKPSKITKKPRTQPLSDVPEITFRNIVEQYAAEHDLVFFPIGKSHEKTGKPLFKVSKNVDGRGGVTVYVGDEAVYAQMEDKEYRAIMLDDMVKRAGG
nr:hypothetical protein L203_01786 [Cryptococcus depauperatus CBS 7841]